MKKISSPSWPFFLASSTTLVGLFLTCLGIFQVNGASMVPTYRDGQVIFVNRLAYGLQLPIIEGYCWMWKAPSLGDSVVLHRDGATKWVVKRVVAVGGMPLEVKDHRLNVGGVTVDLDPAQEYWLSAYAIVPHGYYFVLGDNVRQSQDSRDWGFVSGNEIYGSPLF